MAAAISSTFPSSSANPPSPLDSPAAANDNDDIDNDATEKNRVKYINNNEPKKESTDISAPTTVMTTQEIIGAPNNDQR